MSRGGLDWEGIGADYATFAAATALKSVVTASGVTAVEGKAVTITGNGEAGFGSAGQPLLGKIDKYEADGYMTVQYRGCTEMPGVSGSLPTAGQYLVVNGSGAVMASAGAVGPAKAISVNNAPNVNTVMVLIG